MHRVSVGVPATQESRVPAARFNICCCFRLLVLLFVLYDGLRLYVNNAVYHWLSLMSSSRHSPQTGIAYGFGDTHPPSTSGSNKFPQQHFKNPSGCNISKYLRSTASSIAVVWSIMFFTFLWPNGSVKLTTSPARGSCVAAASLAGYSLPFTLEGSIRAARTFASCQSFRDLLSLKYYVCRRAGLVVATPLQRMAL